MMETVFCIHMMETGFFCIHMMETVFFANSIQQFALKKSNSTFTTNSNILILISLQPDCESY